MAEALLAIDQGTTSSRAMVFAPDGAVVSVAQKEFPQVFPHEGWVEHDPEAIWETVALTVRQALAQAKEKGYRVVSAGITNQRETIIIWDRKSGKAIYPAIVWQDRRTAGQCRALKAAGNEAEVRARTGLVLDPYFSATKLVWILDHVEGARAKAVRGELACGTIDSFLLWRLTGGKVHATDATNASRTLLFNIHTQEWDDDLLRLFAIPASLLPEVMDSAASFGVTTGDSIGEAITIGGIAGDQHAATIGQCCFAPGMVKSTYGTGCFMVMNTGDTAVQSSHNLLTTVAYRLQGRVHYALEGSIFIAGAAVQWLRDRLGIIARARDIEALVQQAAPDSRVMFVPALTGLGAPHWNPEARGALFGLTRDSGAAEIARATLEAVCYQTRDLLEAMAEDGHRPSSLRVDGGMVANNWLVQALADTLGVTVERPEIIETTALGAAYLAGLQSGIYASTEALSEQWMRNAICTPALAEAERDKRYRKWQHAVEAVNAFSRSE